MTTNLENLVGALRQELEQYSAMIGLLESQQQHIAQRRAGDVYQSIGPIKLQGHAMQQARHHREECRAQLALSLPQAREATFAQIIPLLAVDEQVLVATLVKQNNDLLARVRQRARQNHLRLSRSIELTQGLLNSIFPSREPRLYNGRGNMKLRRPNQRFIYEGVG